MARLDLPLGIVLAGGEGKRLMPLTADRAKPAVPFGGSYRLVDFVLSNLVNAGFLRIAVLTQYKSHSLDRHITTTWRMSTLLGNYITPVPAQQRLGPRWYTGSADAILQNFNLIHDENPKHVIVFGADHVYRMDPNAMYISHLESGAGVTVAAIRVKRSEASEFGVIELDSDGVTIKAFHEKPKDPPAMPGHPDLCLVSMGNYIFRREAMEEALILDSEDVDSRHDLGAHSFKKLPRCSQVWLMSTHSSRVIQRFSERGLSFLTCVQVQCRVAVLSRQFCRQQVHRWLTSTISLVAHRLVSATRKFLMRKLAPKRVTTTRWSVTLA